MPPNNQCNAKFSWPSPELFPALTLSCSLTAVTMHPELHIPRLPAQCLTQQGFSSFVRLTKLNVESSISVKCVLPKVFYISFFFLQDFSSSSFLHPSSHFFFPFFVFLLPPPVPHRCQKRTTLGAGLWRRWIPPVPPLVSSFCCFLSPSLLCTQSSMLKY